MTWGLKRKDIGDLNMHFVLRRSYIYRERVYLFKMLFTKVKILQSWDSKIRKVGFIFEWSISFHFHRRSACSNSCLPPGRSSCSCWTFLNAVWSLDRLGSSWIIVDHWTGSVLPILSTERLAPKCWKVDGNGGSRNNFFFTSWNWDSKISLSSFHGDLMRYDPGIHSFSPQKKL